MFSEPKTLVFPSNGEECVGYRFILPSQIVTALISGVPAFIDYDSSAIPKTLLLIDSTAEKEYTLTQSSANQDLFAQSSDTLSYFAKANFQLGASKPRVAKKSGRASVTEEYVVPSIRSKLVHLLAVGPKNLHDLSVLLKVGEEEIQEVLDEIGKPQFGSKMYQLKPSAFAQVFPHEWHTYTSKDREVVTKNMNIAFDQLKLPSDAPERMNLISRSRPSQSVAPPNLEKQNEFPRTHSLPPSSTISAPRNPSISRISPTPSAPKKSAALSKKKKAVSKNIPASSDFQIQNHSVGVSVKETEKELEYSEFLKLHTEHMDLFDLLKQLKSATQENDEDAIRKLMEDRPEAVDGDIERGVREITERYLEVRVEVEKFGQELKLKKRGR